MAIRRLLATKVSQTGLAWVLRRVGDVAFVCLGPLVVLASKAARWRGGQLTDDDLGAIVLAVGWIPVGVLLLLAYHMWTRRREQRSAEKPSRDQRQGVAQASSCACVHTYPRSLSRLCWVLGGIIIALGAALSVFDMLMTRDCWLVMSGGATIIVLGVLLDPRLIFAACRFNERLTRTRQIDTTRDSGNRESGAEEGTADRDGEAW